MSLKAKQATKGRSNRQGWTTPEKLYREIERRYSGGGFTFDAACTQANAKCPNGCAIDLGVDGLVADWEGRVWCNPPYDEIAPWVGKALDELAAGNVERVVMLLPARTDQGWFHDLVLPEGRIHWIRGRVAFDPPPGATRSSAAFEASMVVVFEPDLRGRQ